jgi:type II secretory pathway component PulK
MKRKAVFLIFSLWLLVLISLFGLGLGFRTSLQVKKTKLFLNNLRARQLALSGIVLGRTVAGDFAGEADYFGPDPREIFAEEIEYSVPPRPARLTVMISDECTRLNVNEVATRPVLVQAAGELFRQSGLEEPQAKLEYLLDYIDNDLNPHEAGASSEDEGAAKNSPLTVPEELLLVANISAADYSQIEDRVTVFGDGKVNINTVTEEFLTVLLETLPSVPSDIKTEVLEFRAKEDTYYTQGSCASDDDDCQKLPVQLESLFKTGSAVFRIISQAQLAEVTKKITCVVDTDSGKILYWYEQ